MERDFLDSLNQILTKNPYVNRNKNNEYTYGSSSTSSCRIEQDIVVVKDKLGRDVVSVSQIYVDGSATIDDKDKITLPDGTIPTIIKISKEIDEDGSVHHQVLYT